MLILIKFLILGLVSISTAKYDELYWSQCSSLSDLDIISNTVNPMVLTLFFKLFSVYSFEFEKF
jgi:hypothetical protein